MESRETINLISLVMKYWLSDEEDISKISAISDSIEVETELIMLIICQCTHASRQ